MCKKNSVDINAARQVLKQFELWSTLKKYIVDFNSWRLSLWTVLSSAARPTHTLRSQPQSVSYIICPPPVLFVTQGWPTKMIHEKQTFSIKSSAKMHLNKSIVFASSAFSWPPMFTLCSIILKSCDFRWRPSMCWCRNTIFLHLKSLGSKYCHQIESTGHAKGVYTEKKNVCVVFQYKYRNIIKSRYICFRSKMTPNIKSFLKGKEWVYV